MQQRWLRRWRRRSKRKCCWQSLRRVIGQFRSLQLPTSLRNTIWDESGSELRRGSSVYNFGVCSTTEEGFPPQTWTKNRDRRHVSLPERSFSRVFRSFICLASRLRLRAKYPPLLISASGIAGEETYRNMERIRVRSNIFVIPVVPFLDTPKIKSGKETAHKLV